LSAADSLLLEQLRQVLARCVASNQGLLDSPDVLRVSQELDQLVLKLMQQGGER
jgi:hypothetical protein